MESLTCKWPTSQITKNCQCYLCLRTLLYTVNYILVYAAWKKHTSIERDQHIKTWIQKKFYFETEILSLRMGLWELMVDARDWIIAKIRFSIKKHLVINWPRHFLSFSQDHMSAVTTWWVSLLVERPRWQIQPSPVIGFCWFVALESITISFVFFFKLI